jgi:hypothetical protein
MSGRPPIEEMVCHRVFSAGGKWSTRRCEGARCATRDTRCVVLVPGWPCAPDEDELCDPVREWLADEAPALPQAASAAVASVARRQPMRRRYEEVTIDEGGKRSAGRED